MPRPADRTQDAGSHRGSTTTRRGFLTTAALVGGPLLATRRAAFASEANSRLNLGMVGCGGRGTFMADLFVEHGGYQLTAAADYFQDRVDKFSEKFQVAAGKRYTGLDGYKKILDTDVDAVVIESPPCFHPPQASDAVDAGKHVYTAKPVAVDVPGCRTIEESARRATEAGRVFLVDFQTRTDSLYKEAIKRAQYGDIGRIICGEATYVCGPTWGAQAQWLEENPNDPEMRLKAWGLDRGMSGDVITEQNIHALDVASWVLDAAPLWASGTGGQGARTAGDCWDHFSVTFQFPNDVLVTFCSKQLGDGWDDICCRMYGTDGTLDTHYFGDVSIRGRLPYRGGEVPSLYRNGAAANVEAFHDAVTAGDVSNPTVAPSVRSNLITILGRTAAWRHGRVTWEEMMSANEALEPDLSGLRS